MNKTPLKPDHKVFADKYLETGNKRKSALVARPHLKPASADIHANRMLRNAKVRSYLESHAETAVSNIAFLANNAKSETVKLRANQDILDRSGYKLDDQSPAGTTPVKPGDQTEYLKSILEAINNGDTVTLERIILSGTN